MQKTRFFLKGSAAEIKWLNRQAQRGHKLSGINGNHYQFVEDAQASPVMAEYMPTKTLAAMAEMFHPQAQYEFGKPDIAVAYSPIAPQQRMVTSDHKYRLKVNREARSQALNWMNGLVIAIWLLLSFATILSAKANGSAHAMTAQLGLAMLIGTGLMFVAIAICGRAALRAHHQVCELIRLTGDDEDAWKPTFHVIFKHQRDLPDVSRFEALGKWHLSMQNDHGEYFFDLRTNLNEEEIKNALLKMIKQQDFTVMSWLGLFPL